GWQVFLSVAMVAALLAITTFSVPTVAQVVMFIGPSLRDAAFWMGVVTVLTVYVSYFLVVFQLTAAQLTFEADNRSSQVRVALVIQFVAMLGWIGYWWVAEGDRDYGVLIVLCSLLCAQWFVVGSLLAAEFPGLSARVVRQLPRRRAWRSIAAAFFPGPGTA